MLIRILELATGLVALTTILVLSSVTGMRAYMAFRPESFQAQVVNVTFPEEVSTSTLPIDTASSSVSSGAQVRPASSSTALPE